MKRGTFCGEHSEILSTLFRVCFFISTLCSSIGNKLTWKRTHPPPSPPPARGKCNICAFHKEIHVVEDCFLVRLSSLVFASERTTNRKTVCSLIDRLVTSEGGVTLILPFTSKTGQSVAQNRQMIFYLDFISAERHILAFYRLIFRLQT